MHMQTCGTPKTVTETSKTTNFQTRFFYRILGIIRGRNVSWITFFSIVRKSFSLLYILITSQLKTHYPAF